MGPSVDGRIVVDKWPNLDAVFAEYERTAELLEGDAWMIGRVSMAPYAGKAKVPKQKAKFPRVDFVAEHSAESFAIAIDSSGKLRWRANDIDGEHVIAVLTERVSDDYLAFLRGKQISYVFGGKTEVNLARVLEKLGSKFGIKRLLLEGGGKINGTLLAADLIDELSVLVVPVADGSVGSPSLFDAGERSKARALKLMSVEQRGDFVWLRYRRAR